MNTTLEHQQKLVTDFLSQSPLKAFIGGEWVAAADGATFTTRDPGTGTPLAEIEALVHENGHAVHISAIRNRTAFTDWPDTLFTEAFADVIRRELAVLPKMALDLGLKMD